MVNVPVTFASDERTYGGLPARVLKNRFFEASPTQVSGAAMLARPGTDDYGTYGDGPIRANYSLPGLFDGALFTVSGGSLYRTETDGTVNQISGTIFNAGEVVMTGVAGPDYERLFIADGTLLQVYQGGTNATGTLTAASNPTNGEEVRIGDTWYAFATVVADGTGTDADPFQVLIGADKEASMVNLFKALTFTGVRGTTYSSTLGGQNTDVEAEINDDEDEITVTSRTDLSAGNSIATTTDAVGLSWGAASLSGGGVHALSGVEVPDGQPPISVATLKSYIIVAIANSDRFYWIEPGELTIDALDFATAESQPDDTVAMTVVGDTVWFIGEGSTEVWYPSGSADAPFLPVSGRVYDRGAIEGTVVNVKGVVFLVGRDYIVYAISGAAERISTHGVEQTIREALGG